MVNYKNPNQPVFSTNKNIPYGYNQDSSLDPYGNPTNPGELTRTVGSRGSNNYIAGGVPQGGQGKPFTIERQAQAVETLGQGITNPEGDSDIRGALRNQIMASLNQGNNGQGERDLNRTLAVARRQAGGSGTSSSQQYGRNLGDIVGGYNRGAQEAESARLNNLVQAEGGTLTQALQERGYTLTQAKSLADLLQNQAQVEQNSILGTATSLGPSDFEKGLGAVLGLGGAALGGGLFSKKSA